MFDSNIYVSALTLPGGRADAAIQKVISGEVQLAISKAIVGEVLGVLADKFDRNVEELARVAVFLADLAEVVTPRSTVDVLADEPDNRVLECARAGRAGVIVTGDRRILALGEFEGITILSLRQFLERSGPAEGPDDE
ncbi:MAG: putative toxin-antitoxin system toxin component, PIN family [Gemmatimonadetes bacterium]|nr:putative toxin-antitoxin system toxin component, PIN family [Gemmatimonadota bacterium]